MTTNTQALPRRPLAFLDSNVIIEYLRNHPPSSRLFSREILEKVQFAINAVVLQEVFTLAEARQHPELLTQLQDTLTLLPINGDKIEEYLKNASTLRNRLAHSNDLIILSSASDCDYLVTNDEMLIRLAAGQKPRVVTPSQLLAEIGGEQ